MKQHQKVTPVASPESSVIVRVLLIETYMWGNVSCSCSAAMGIFDAIQLCRADVSTICFGLAASTATIVLAGGSKGRRFAMPNSRIMMHQPMGGASGQAIDVEIQAKEIMYHKTNITRILSEITGRPFEQVWFLASSVFTEMLFRLWVFLLRDSWIWA